MWFGEVSGRMKMYAIPVAALIALATVRNVRPPARSRILLGPPARMY